MAPTATTVQENLARLEQRLQRGEVDAVLAQLEAWVNRYPAESAYPLALARWIGQYTQNPNQAFAVLDAVDHTFGLLPEACSLRAHFLAQNGQPKAALEVLSAVLESHPTEWATYAQLAELLEQHDYWEERQAVLLRATDHCPGWLEGWLKLVQGWQQLGDPVRALAALEDALKQHPNEALLHLLKGAALEESGKGAEAETSYQQAFAVVGGNAPTLHRLAGEFFAARDDAPKAIHHWSEVLLSQPDDTETTVRLAHLFIQQRRSDAAAALLQRTLSHHLQPDPALLTELAQVYARQGLMELAVETFNRVLTMQPEARWLEIQKALATPVVYSHEAILQQSVNRATMALKTIGKFPPTLSNPIEQVGATPYLLSLTGQPYRPVAEAFAQACSGAVLPNDLSPLAPLPSANEPLKVGIVSRLAFLSGHWVASSLGGLWPALPRANDLEWHFFPLVEEPKQTNRPLWLQPTDLWHPLSKGDFASQVQRLRAARLHALLFVDVGLEPASTVLAQHSLAPSQWVLPVHPVTTGSATVNGLLLPIAQIPASATEFTEPLCPVEGPFWAPLPLKETPSQLDRDTFGVAYGEQLLLCPAPLYKLHPAMDTCWAAMLQRHPKARLFFFQADETAWNRAFEHRLSQTLSEDARNRVTLVAPLRPADRLRLFQLADVVLDVTPANDWPGMLLAAQLGAPVITLATDTPLGRQTAVGLKGYAGLQVAYTEAAYQQAVLDCLNHAPSPRFQYALPPSEPLARQLTQTLRQQVTVVLTGNKL